jgi:hypothetical protein
VNAYCSISIRNSTYCRYHYNQIRKASLAMQPSPAGKMGPKAGGSSVRLTFGPSIKVTRGLLSDPGRLTSWINYEEHLPRHSTQIGGFGHPPFSRRGGNRDCLAGTYGPAFESPATPGTPSPGHCLDAAAGPPNSAFTRPTPCALFNDLDGNRPGTAAIRQ